jgi:hypothetical protein
VRERVRERERKREHREREIYVEREYFCFASLVVLITYL